MRYKKAYALPGVLLAAGSIALATMARPASPSELETLSIPATPAPIMLACGPEYVTTMGESTAGIEQTQTKPITQASAFALGGEDPTVGGEPMTGSDVASWVGATSATVAVDPGETPALAAGLNLHLQETGELAGLALTPCQTPSSDQVLVGGTTGLSASAELVVTSVSSTPAQVNVEVLTSTGYAPATPISNFTVGGRQTQRVLIEAGVIDDRIALHVTSRGGRVATFLYTHAVDGLVGTGVATVNPGDEPSTAQVIPAVMLGQDSTLRVANPGTEPATISAFVDDGEIREIPGTTDVKVAPGAVLDLSLSGLGDQTAAILVDSDQPVAAAAMSATDSDRGWMPAVPASRKVGSMIPKGTVTLFATAEASTPAVATFYDKNGAEITAENLQIRATSIEIPEGATSVVLEAESPVRAGMWVLRSEGETQGIEGMPLTVPPASSTELNLVVSN